MNYAYTYDASGNKLKKTVVDNTGTNLVTTTTYYLAGAVYEQKTTSPAASGDYGPRLQFLSHEEGRIRKDTTSNTYNYDYFVKDHLGNIRMVLTSELDTAFYPAATMETASSSVEEAFYSNLNSRADKPAGYPIDPYVSGTNDKVARLRGDGTKIGPAIALKVMAGDKFNVHVSSYYKLNGSSPQSPNAITDLATVISGSFGGIVGGKYTSSEISGTSSFTNGVSSFLSNQSTPSLKPKAYLNWILFDEQFNYVSGHVDEVGNDDALKSHDFANQAITKNGYLYIYVSNETPNVYVYFDNLQITHIKGQILEEHHYYPGGLRMEGICSRAAGGIENKYQYAGKERQAKEFSDGSGLEYLDFGARMYDGQIGRFLTQDRYTEKYYTLTPYQYAANNPMLFMDNNGDSLILVGNAQALADANQTINDGLGGFYTASQDANGNTTLTATDQKGKMTKAQQEFYNTLNGIIGLSGNVTVGVMQGSRDIIVGSYDLESVDICDIQAANGNGVVTPQSLLGHELQEQKAKQIDGKAYPDAHKEGVAAENKIGGYTRSDGLLPSSKTSQNVLGQVSGNLDQKFTKGGKAYVVTLNLTKNELTSVSAKLSGPPPPKKKP